MSTFCLDPERGDARRRSKRTLATSLGVHAIVILWLALHQTLAAPDEGLVEIAWLEPLPAAVEAAPIVTPDPAPVSAAPVELPRAEDAAVRETVERKFERPETVTETAPRPQDPAVSADRVKERLAALRRLQDGPKVSVAVSSMASTLPRPSATTAVPAQSETAPQRLVRSAAPAEPVTLKRSGSSRPRPVAPLATAAPESPTVEAVRVETDEVRQILGGVELSGQVVDRPLLSHRLPDYPEWAAREAVEGSTTLSFVVLADGSVRSDIQIQKTSGFSDFDRNATAALRDWRFEALTGGRREAQQGTITFRFRLRDR